MDANVILDLVPAGIGLISAYAKSCQSLIDDMQIMIHAKAYPKVEVTKRGHSTILETKLTINRGADQDAGHTQTIACKEELPEPLITGSILDLEDAMIRVIVIVEILTLLIDEPDLGEDGVDAWVLI